MKGRIMGRKLHADERGISPVMGAALTIGVIIAVSSVFLAVWVPSEVNRREEEYMRGVEGSFRELGATIGDLRVGENGSVDLKMGSDPVPLVPNPEMGGTLSVTPAENIWQEIPKKIARSDLGHVKFDWGSRSLVYESGMIILVQDNMSFMKSPPGALTVRQVDENNLEVYFNAIRVRRFGGSVSGTGTSTITVSVLQEFTKLGEIEENEENEVTIWTNTSRHRDAWWEYLTNKADELEAIGIDAKAKWKPKENTFTLTIEWGGENIHFYQKVIDIEVNLE